MMMEERPRSDDDEEGLPEDGSVNPMEDADPAGIAGSGDTRRSVDGSGDTR
ncbi:MAG: hypothetical protein M3Q15_00875 [Pseudomonadota bacterium]|nr:hypothetical protein [Pseudomonadota bacterium]